MTGSHEQIGTPPQNVTTFARRFNLEESLRVTEELVRQEFGRSLSELRMTILNDAPEEDEVTELVAVDIEVSGDTESFHDAYGRFISGWTRRVEPDVHKLIQFRFHITDQ